MKIARVVHLFYPEAIGDPFSTNELSQRQAQRGDSVRVYTWSRSGRPSVLQAGPNLAVVRLRGPNLRVPFLFDEYPFLPTLGGDLSRGGFDVVHAHSHLFLTTLQATNATRRHRIPLVVTVHGVIAQRGFPTDSLQRAYLYTMGRRVFDSAARVICVTKSDAEEVVATGCPRSKIRVIPNAVDGQLFKPGPMEREEDEVLWVGRFVPEKGIETLLLALKLVLRHRRVNLRLVGDGPLRARIEGMADRLSIGRNVVFQGQVDGRDVARAMSEASVFAFPSVKEGLPKVLLEAMASGLGVVASNIPGVTEVVTDGKNGLTFRRGDAEGLAKAILTLLDDRRMAKRLGSEARKTVLGRYSWEVMLESLNRAYEEACGIA